MIRQKRRSAPRRSAAAYANPDARAAAAGVARISRWVNTHLLMALCAGTLILCLAFVGVFLWGAEYKVGQVQVTGADLLDANAIRDSVNVSGKSLLLANSARIEARLRKEYIVIARVNVVRELPNKVTIHIEEQPARWAWESAGRYWWLRIDGTVIGEMADAGKLPVIHDIYRAFSEPDGYIPGVPWALAEAMLQALPVIPAFDYTVNEGLIVYVTDKQWPVYLGTSGNAQLKTEILTVLVKQLSDQQVNVAYIDLRNEAKPIYKKPA
jgi:cell division septal protein FtsQ